MLTIGSVARRIGVRPSAIRYYETRGIIRPAARGANGYRLYDTDALKVLSFVRRAQSLGITLKEMKPLLTVASQGRQPCRHVKQLARTHLREIDKKIQELQALQGELHVLLRLKARRTRTDEVCPMIQRGSGQAKTYKA